MSREVPLWVGATDDTAIPPRVKLRIWEREGGRCYLSGRKIMPGEAFQYEHVVALCNGGRNAEDNIRLALSAPHKAKTARDVAEKSKVARVRQKHLGIKSGRGFPKHPTMKRTISGQVVPR